MGKIYVGQSALTIQLETDVDISAATVTRICYKKPSGTIGHWAASVVGDNNDTLEYDVAEANQLDEAGNWTLWAYAEFDSGIAYGEAARLAVSEVGT